MSDRRYSPAYLRYFKARLWSLARPGFWGTAIFLSVVGLVVKEYWTNSDFFNFKQAQQTSTKKTTNYSLSEEDKAIAADIDNLPVLFYDFKNKDITTTTSNTNQKNQAKNSNIILDNISKQKTVTTQNNSDGLKLVSPISSSKLENPFVTQTENLLQFKNFQNDNQFSGMNGLTSSSTPTDRSQTSTNLGTGLTNPISSHSTNTIVSPLQTALNQSTNQSLSIGNSKIPTQANSLLLPNQNLLPTAGLNGNAIASVNNGKNYQNFAPSLTNIPNQSPNFSTNPTSNQTTPSVSSPTSAITPISLTAPSNLTPSYTQTPNQNPIHPSNSAVNSYSGNASSLQQPSQVNGISYP